MLMRAWDNWRRRRQRNLGGKTLDLKAEHSPEAVQARLHAGPNTSYVRDFVYGAIDGAVTTFAVVSGVAGAGLSPGVIIILGVSNLIGDGFSMAASNFLATRAEQQLREKARRTEEQHISAFPEGEREEVRQIFAAKGFAGADLERVVDVITSNVNQWVDTMLREELGLTPGGPVPARAALATFVAFVIIGTIPLLPFLTEVIPGLGVPRPFLCSAVLTGAAFFIVGAWKGRFVEERWWIAGLETLGVGGCAAALAYLVGLFLKNVVGVNA